MNTARILNMLGWIALLSGAVAFVLFLLGWDSHQSTIQLIRAGALRVALILGPLGLLLGRQYGREQLATVPSVLAFVAVALSLLLSLWS
jgi:hypothetical protein